MRHAILAITVAGMVLGSCSKPPTAQHEISTCWLDALKNYSAQKRDDLKARMNDYIYVCMKAKGYEFSADPAKIYCKLGRDEAYDFLAETNVDCYDKKAD
jgi:hypothetical protein